MGSVEECKPDKYGDMKVEFPTRMRLVEEKIKEHVQFVNRSDCSSQEEESFFWRTLERYIVNAVVRKSVCQT